MKKNKKVFKKKRKSEIYRIFTDFYRNLNTRLVIWWVLFLLLTFILLIPNLMRSTVVLNTGDISDADIYHEGSSVSFSSDLRTRQLLDEMVQSIDPVYNSDAEAEKKLLEKTDRFFATVIKVKGMPGSLALEERIQLAREKTGYDFEQETWIYLLGPASDLPGIQEKFLQPFQDIYEEDVTQESLTGIKGNAVEWFLVHGESEEEKQFLQEFLDLTEIPANKVYDAIATAAIMEQQMDALEPVKVMIKSGQKIVEKGTVVTEEQSEILEFLGLRQGPSQVLIYFGLFGFVLLVYSFFITYLYRFQRGIFFNLSSVILLGILINLAVLIGTLINSVNLDLGIEYSAQLAYLTPLSAFAILAAILLNKQVAVFITMVLALFTSVTVQGHAAYVNLVLLSGFVGIYLVTKRGQKFNMAKASFYIALVNAVVAFCWGLIFSQSLFLVSFGVIMGILHGLLAAVLAIGLMPFFESTFRITTTSKLLELSSPHHPLLKQLTMEAPGTYHHSVMVANLAEAAADEIGADSLLVRVASYYHDIGKIKRPAFFIENQMGEENPHDKLTPNLSMLIITAHVKDGVEIAKEFKFPDAIIEMIEQHHGKSVVSFFYNKAKEENGDQVLESDFRYNYPKPQTKEAAVIMLADSVQAAIQAVHKPTQGYIEGKVREVINQKFEDHQLDECNLTFKDLDIIAKAFVRVLNGIYHHRIEYPDSVIKEMERKGIKNGDPAAKSTK